MQQTARQLDFFRVLDGGKANEYPDYKSKVIAEQQKAYTVSKSGDWVNEPEREPLPPTG